MTPDEFINATMGKVTWKKYAADWQHMDCFGLVDMFFKHVHGLELTWATHLSCYASHGWIEVLEPVANSVAFMTWSDGVPTHCGVCLGRGMLLHCDGNETNPGGVRINTIEAVQKLYGEIRFYAYHPA